MRHILAKIWPLLVILVIALAFRIYKIDTPLIEYHSWRQADTAAVARNLVRGGYDLLHPLYDDISKLQSGLENPRGYRMVEFPLYNLLFAVLWQTMPFISLTIWGRIVSIICALVTVSCIYLIARREGGTLAGWIAGMIYAVYPFFVFYTRAILPENLAIASIMAGLTLMYLRPALWTKVLAWVLFAAALLVKPTAIFFALAYAVLLYHEHPHKSIVSRLVWIGVYLGLSMIPLALWRWHIGHFPEGIPSSEWLLTSVNTPEGLKPIFMRPAFFRWVLYERITLLIMGVYSVPLLVFGLILKKKSWFPIALLASSAVYVLTFQGGNVQHEYYQILILPVIALYAGWGAAYLYRRFHGFTQRTLVMSTVCFVLVLSWMSAWDRVRHYYYALSDIPRFASIVQTFVPADEKIVVDTGGDTTALYAFDRKGAPAIVDDPPKLKEKGYQYLFTYNSETATNLEKNFGIKVLFRNDRMTLFRL